MPFAVSWDDALWGEESSFRLVGEESDLCLVVEIPASRLNDDAVKLGEIHIFRKREVRIDPVVSFRKVSHEGPRIARLREFPFVAA